MVKRTASGKEEPEQMKFENPSEKEHLFQCVDIFDSSNSPGNMELDADTVCAKLEVVGGDEEGRTVLNRMTLDDNGKGFFATRLFLKACGLEYKGDNFPIDTEQWAGKQFYATVVHKGKYANIKEFNFDKMVEQVNTTIGDSHPSDPVNSDEIAWDDDK